jgi:hypothetical protein
MVKTNILVVYSFLCNNKKFLENLVHTTHCKLGNKMTATLISYFFNINYDAHLWDLAFRGTCISYTSVA